MKNTITCENCRSENPHYALNCKSCKAYLRTRIVNIDLWQFIGKLIESPVKGFTNIIYSEHKNFVLMLLVLAGLKYFLNAIIFSQTININYGTTDNLAYNYLISEGYLIAIVVLFSLIVTLMNKSLGLLTRFKDNFAILVYSFIPLIFSVVILTPVQIALFGTHWFNFNPPPYVIKPMVFWVIIFIEGIMVLWSAFLVIAGFYAQSKNILYSLIVGLIFTIIIYCGMIYLPLLPF